MEFWDEFLRFVVLLFVKLAMCIQIKFKICNESSGMREQTKSVWHYIVWLENRNYSEG